MQKIVKKNAVEANPNPNTNPIPNTIRTPTQT